MEIRPIEAIIYNQNKVDMKDVIAPPYDVIDKKYQQDLYDRSKYNIVRLILSNANNPYEAAKADFEEWKKEEVLVKTDKPSIFYIIQKYTNEKGEKIERKGFIARNKIESFESKKILPHEYTMGGPKEDRFKLISATGAFFSQIFLVYDDKTMAIEKLMQEKYFVKKPDIDVVDDLGVENIVYIIDDADDIKLFQDTLQDKTLLIADGHHRYETSMRYAKEHPQNAYAQFVMSYFTNAQDENLIIYPTHRVIEKEFDADDVLDKVSKYYDIETIQGKDNFLAKIEEENKKHITTGLILKGKKDFYILKLKKDMEKTVDAPSALQKLDLEVLHQLILKKELGYTQDELMAQNGIKYEKKESVAFGVIDENKASAVFIMAYPKMQDILNVSQEGLRMPQKSTYFYPKLLSGLVINPLK